MRKYVAFDIEIAKVLPDGVEDWMRYRPLGISCAAALTSDGRQLLWCGRLPGEKIADQLNRDELWGLVGELQAFVAAGYTLLTWNGLGFDFDILAEESGMWEVCRDLAMAHTDMMFHVFCLKGFAVALDKAARGMGLRGKPPGMNGSLVPKYWASGRRQEVLDYVVQDVRTTLELASATEQQRCMRWISSSGSPKELPLPNGWLTVEQALKLPLPDTSWMRTPWPRSKFTGWLNRPMQ